VARYLYGEAADELLARWRPQDGLAWYLTDNVGSVRDITNATGTAVINHIEYSAFGKVLSQTNASAGDRFLFTGREYEVAIGLYYYRARFYDPATGRLNSEDPRGFQDLQWNLFTYVANAPTLYTDPFGEAALTEYVKLAARSTKAAIDSCIRNLGISGVLTTTIYIIGATHGTSRFSEGYVGRTQGNQNTRHGQHQARRRFGVTVSALLSSTKVPTAYRRQFEQFAMETFDRFAGNGHRLNRRNEVRGRVGAPRRLGCADILTLI